LIELVIVEKIGKNQFVQKNCSFRGAVVQQVVIFWWN